MTALCHTINSIGQCFLWDNQQQICHADPKFIASYQETIWRTEKDHFVTSASEKINSEVKLHLFADAKDTISISKYITSINNRRKRSILCKLRMGVLDLEIERGRRVGTSRAERFCKLCNQRKVEDAIHFTMECPALADCRSQGLNKLQALNPAISEI